MATKRTLPAGTARYVTLPGVLANDQRVPLGSATKPPTAPPAVPWTPATREGDRDEWLKKAASEFPKGLAWDAPAPFKADADGNYPIPIPGIYKAY